MADENVSTSTAESDGVLSGDNSQQENAGGVLSGDNAGQEDKTQQDNNATQEGDSTQEGKTESEDKPEGAPEQYAAWNVPEGVQIDEKTSGEFGTLAKELNLTQENAQKLVDFQVKYMQQIAEQQTKSLDEQVAKQAADWKAETYKAFSKEEIADAVRGFRAAPKAVQEMLAACGFDNHKDFVAFFKTVGRSLKEDTFEMGKGGGTAKKSAANVLYPELN